MKCTGKDTGLLLEINIPNLFIVMDTTGKTVQGIFSAVPLLPGVISQTGQMVSIQPKSYLRKGLRAPQGHSSRMPLPIMSLSSITGPIGTDADVVVVGWEGDGQLMVLSL